MRQLLDMGLGMPQTAKRHLQWEEEDPLLPVLGRCHRLKQLGRVMHGYLLRIPCEAGSDQNQGKPSCASYQGQQH